MGTKRLAQAKAPCAVVIPIYESDGSMPVSLCVTARDGSSGGVTESDVLQPPLALDKMGQCLRFANESGPERSIP